ncbi:MAG: MBL fold metallo-hydrolase [Chloroflexi bacterium]|nr:MAG: MBL fold metallo-hydrolase [Chloroflexota bacterium]
MHRARRHGGAATRPRGDLVAQGAPARRRQRDRVTVRVHFLGSGNAFSDGGRANAAIHVTAPGVSLLLDCGGSALPAIKKHVDPATIDAIAVTHLHGDHFGGITFFAIEQHFAGRTKELVTAGPPSLEQRLRLEEQALYPDFFGPVKLGFAHRTVVLGAEPTDLGGARVTALPVRHVRLAEPHGLRVEVAGKLIAYSGDARWTEHLAAVAKGADLFICEASYFDRDDPAHISYRTLMEHRDELGAKRIVLTHLGAETLARLSEIELEHTNDGMVIEV